MIIRASFLETNYSEIFWKLSENIRSTLASRENMFCRLIFLFFRPIHWLIFSFFPFLLFVTLSLADKKLTHFVLSRSFRLRRSRLSGAIKKWNLKRLSWLCRVRPFITLTLKIIFDLCFFTTTSSSAVSEVKSNLVQHEVEPKFHHEADVV